mgnify:CR=1 FL=1
MENTLLIKVKNTEKGFAIELDTHNVKFTAEDMANVASVCLPSLIVEILKDLPTKDGMDKNEAFEGAVMHTVGNIMGKFLSIKSEREEKDAKQQTEKKPTWGLDCDCETEA